MGLSNERHCLQVLQERAARYSDVSLQCIRHGLDVATQYPDAEDNHPDDASQRCHKIKPKLFFFISNSQLAFIVVIYPQGWSAQDVVTT
ncbi:hypothetical protein GDO78_000298 [Eleutherodactylus coqui]|uniref:Uncharacterized protein n=1 Tax=Eleutherodactylus coqui TaxID=57060 RepID=A0A8J6KF75_ELECQ|nr:hypothetical protein GDO78_000298 [Eleutherodactylus coqui]